MTDIRALVSWRATTEPPKHACSNTLYFQAALGVGDWDDICDQIAEAYETGREGEYPGSVRLIPQGWQINVRLYDMADAKPRPIKAETTIPMTTSTDTGAREVSLCLSYYGDRNLPSTRGRIYLGPFAGSVVANQRPNVTLRNSIIGLGQALSGVGGEDISWRVHSTKNGTYNHIRHIWCDDEWDTMRSRQLEATTRTTADV